MKMSAKAASDSIRVDNRALAAKKTANIWAEREKKVSPSSAHYSAIAGVQAAYNNVESADIKTIDKAMLDFKIAVDAANEAYSEFKKELANNAVIEKCQKDFDALTTQFEIISGGKKGISKWNSVMQSQAADVASAHAAFEMLKKNGGSPEDYDKALKDYKRTIDMVNGSLANMNSMHGTIAGKLSDTAKEFIKIASAREVLHLLKRGISEMVEEVKAIDTAMVNLRRLQMKATPLISSSLIMLVIMLVSSAPRSQT
jgi:hypothetical protein